MKSCASMKKCITAILALLMVFACAVASAQTYRLYDEADEIATIQAALKQLKLYTGEITGHFGPKTETAVKTFQKRNGLVNDGIAGEETIAALYAAAGITSTQVGSSTTTSTPSASGSLLRYDSSGDAVLKLQQDLNALGFYDGSLSGHFGSMTEAAVKNFQRNHGLSADGVAGTKTLAAIATALGSSSSTTTSSSSSSSSSSASTSSSSSVLKYGTKSEAVRTLQENLKALGYYSTGTVTGNYGNLTKEAVSSFQRDHGLSADGIAGSKTLAAIASAMKGTSSSSSSSSSSSASSSSSSSSSASSGTSSSLLNTTVTLQKNSKSDEVLKLQKMLTTLGFYTGNQTGSFGSLTEDAVKAYQRSKGLTADGIAGKKTLAAINADISGSSVANGSVADPSSLAQKVLYSNFYNWRRNYANGEYCTVYDFSTGYSWKLRIMTKDAHMDAEPATAEDTATMLKAFGGKTTWTPKAVWVTFSDGKTYIGSTHNTPHSPQHLSNNNFNGHLCVHFPIPMETANKIGDYATSHQEAINAGWEKTKQLRY